MSDIDATADAVEGADQAVIGGNVFWPEDSAASQEGASVVITEVPVLSDGTISIRE